MAHLGNFLKLQCMTILPEDFYNYYKSALPGHSVVHVTLWTGGPSQNEPPFRGAGLVQLRVRRCHPRPHRALHSDHSVQEDQPPLTYIDKGGKLSGQSVNTLICSPWMKERKKTLTINNESSSAAASFGHHVASDTGVVCCVQQSGLLDDKIMVNCDQKIGVLRRIDDILILQPVHLKTRTNNRWNKNRELPYKTDQSPNY